VTFLQIIALNKIIYYSDLEEDDDDSGNEGLTTQIVIAVGTITTFLAIVVCIFLSCRHSRYHNCDSSSERSSPRTIQTEDGDGEIALPLSSSSSSKSE
jgi:hypothetical protein